MLDFRKVLLAAAVAGLGLAGSASAQVWQGGQLAPVPSTGYAFIESTTQLVPTISIPIGNPTNGNAPPAGTAVSLYLNSNVAISNVLATGSSSNLDIAVYTSTVANNCAVAVDTATSVINTSSPTQIQITFSTITAAAPALICVQNLRVNASQVGSSAAITVSTGFAGSAFVPASSATTNTATVAYAFKSIGAVTIQPQGNAGGDAADANNINTSLCTTFPSTTSSAAAATGTSGFAVATLQIPTSPNALVPAASLSGGAAVSGNAPVAATQGVRYAITLTNLAANVNYYVAPPSYGVAGPTMVYYTAASGSGTVSAAGAPTTQPDNVATDFPLTVTNGTATFYVGVTANTAPTLANQVNITIVANIPSNAAVQAFPTSPVAASIILVGATSGYPQYASTQTAYASSPVTNSSKGLLTGCSTTLLFPYVTNSAGFDTGIVITDASTSASGLCTVTFYGTGAATNPIVYSPTTSLSATANTLSFSASAQAPGITGYAVAQCNFVGAHGYAFLFSGAGTPAAYAADYLAIVTQTNGAATTPTF